MPPNRRPVVMDATAACGVSLAWISAAIPGVNGIRMSTSGKQKKPRSSRMTRKSWAIASIAPAPKACPTTAATVGIGKVSIRASRPCTRPTYQSP
ncbi:hypothetical protein BN970_00212 [Mycolicibacterium conceptionense]|uniref:Uncharacterized protein n=1 Tax=Mycolicibacterium conceptionense TaxID=451644 RepID=A0A0U1CVD2_9MYCO|nr:hypothetical protein BN970_00212 [Mycolicibacterium conceptionense]